MRCKFKHDSDLPADAETRAISTGNDELNHHNGVVLERCIIEPGFDYGLHIGGGSGAWGNWGSVGGGSSLIVESKIHSRVGAFVGSSDTYRVRADLRGVLPGPSMEELLHLPSSEGHPFGDIFE